MATQVFECIHDRKLRHLGAPKLQTRSCPRCGACPSEGSPNQRRRRASTRPLRLVAPSDGAKGSRGHRLFLHHRRLGVKLPPPSCPSPPPWDPWLAVAVGQHDRHRREGDDLKRPIIEVSSVQSQMAATPVRTAVAEVAATAKKPTVMPMLATSKHPGNTSML